MKTSRREMVNRQIGLINACAAKVSAVVGDAKIRLRDFEANERIDGRMVIQGSWGSKKFTLEAEERVTAANINAVIARLRGGKRARLLVTRYVNPVTAAILREHKINFADAAGNVYLSDPPLFVWQHGFKGEATSQRPARIFQVAGLKILSVLLWKPEAVNATYRALADQAGVSLGAIVPVFEDLAKGGFLHTAKKQRRLSRHRELLEQWVIGYAGQLFPRLILKTCRLAANQTFEGLAERLRVGRFGADGLLGGELAAGMATDYLRAGRAAIHVDASAAAIWMGALRLVPDPDGNVDLIERFAGGNRWEDPPAGLRGISCVNPVLLYGELLRLGGDDRLRETAGLVFEKFIAPRFGERA